MFGARDVSHVRAGAIRGRGGVLRLPPATAPPHLPRRLDHTHTSKHQGQTQPSHLTHSASLYALYQLISSSLDTSTAADLWTHAPHSQHAPRSPTTPTTTTTTTPTAVAPTLSPCCCSKTPPGTPHHQAGTAPKKQRPHHHPKHQRGLERQTSWWCHVPPIHPPPGRPCWCCVILIIVVPEQLLWAAPCGLGWWWCKRGF